jgi:hypothetical protein
VGVAPVEKGVPAHIAAAITDVTHTVFLNGMTESFLVAFGVAIVGALLALITRKGHATGH